MAHFSVFFTYMEEAEHELLRHLGTSVVAEDAGGVVSWPRVAARCDYRLPARFEDVLAIELRIERLGTKSVTYAARFLRGGDVLAEGEVTTVCCRISPDGTHQSTPIPLDLRNRLGPYVQNA